MMSPSRIARRDGLLAWIIAFKAFKAVTLTALGIALVAAHRSDPVEDLVRLAIAVHLPLTSRERARLDVHDTHFQGTAPSGRFEDFHGVHLVFRGTVPHDAEPRVVETDGTTDDVAWVPLADVESGTVRTLDVVRSALEARSVD